MRFLTRFSPSQFVLSLPLPPSGYSSAWKLLIILYCLYPTIFIYFMHSFCSSTDLSAFSKSPHAPIQGEKVKGLFFLVLLFPMLQITERLGSKVAVVTNAACGIIGRDAITNTMREV